MPNQNEELNTISSCEDGVPNLQRAAEMPMRELFVLAAEMIEALAAEVVRLRAAIVGAQIALARDENISAAMRILVQTGVQNG